MNIFFLDQNPTKCAEYHFDKHVRKMILETAQMLSTAHRVLDGKEVETRNKAGARMKRYILQNELEDVLYKSTHVNHPSNKWVRESSENYLWLYQLLLSLLNEYQYRFTKEHATSRLIEPLKVLPKNIQVKEFTQPPAAMDKEFIISKDNVVNYRNYYVFGKIDLLQYTKRDIPVWLKED